MHPALQSALVFLGAGLGANARYWLGRHVAASPAGFPWATLLINVSGSLLLGLLAGGLLGRPVPVVWKLLFGVGVLGGYTTFSTFSVETLEMIQQRQFGSAAGYVLLSVLGGLLAATLGFVLAERMLPHN